ncbi:STM4015 family protein [Streptomyces sp. DSM 42041]|uniref:STM4015 family protein n=1 Tax=Streptomyces hazeniae TaxID=3075538 RepID=A0ABU2NUH7_9ACTN|nr:STM4015 family protein [Streptomyces sp. DSM 42041]MDT0380637.1 STM4015 family protein [Streptomyces sp. DSM 42041]
MSGVGLMEELGGLPVWDFPAPGDRKELPAADAVAWRLSVDPYGDDDESFQECWERFARTVDLSAVRALLVGVWGECYENDSSAVVGLITGAKDRLTSLRAFFLGDQDQEQNEISWIEHDDVTPLLHAFPGLEVLGIRGGTGLRFPALRHDALHTLLVETGGLPGAVVRGIGESDLPALENLELWLGDPNYGGDTEVGDLSAILGGERLPRLRHLGIQNSPIQDEVAAAVVAAPVVARLSSLSLSMGVLTDTGGEALLKGRAALSHLRRLDLHFHFLSDAMTAALPEAFPGVRVDVSEQTKPDEYRGETYRYVAVAE